MSKSLKNTLDNIGHLDKCSNAYVSVLTIDRLINFTNLTEFIENHTCHTTNEYGS